jgi:glycyl-tRNA synthetase alpha chain
VGGIDLDPVSVELTYGLERIAMYLQQKNSVYELEWAPGVKYGDVYHKSEAQFSKYNFEVADTELLFSHFTDFEQECERCLANELPLPAYDYVLKCSHNFNLLDSRGVISVTDRTGYIARVRNLARRCAEMYLSQQQAEAG